MPCFFVSPELQSVSQERAELHPHNWLDVVLPGDRLLQEEVGRRPKDGGEDSSEPARLSGKLLGVSRLVIAVAERVPDLLILLLNNLCPASFCSTVKARA